MSVRKGTTTKTELAAIYRLEFYKKQTNWKFCKEAAKKTEVNSKEILNQTYCIQVPKTDAASSPLNKAFIVSGSGSEIAAANSTQSPKSNSTPETASTEAFPDQPLNENVLPESTLSKPEQIPNQNLPEWNPPEQNLPKERPEHKIVANQVNKLLLRPERNLLLSNPEYQFVSNQGREGNQWTPPKENLSDQRNKRVSKPSSQLLNQENQWIRPEQNLQEQRNISNQENRWKIPEQNLLEVQFKADQRNKWPPKPGCQTTNQGNQARAVQYLEALHYRATRNQESKWAFQEQNMLEAQYIIDQRNKWTSKPPPQFLSYHGNQWAIPVQNLSEVQYVADHSELQFLPNRARPEQILPEPQDMWTKPQQNLPEQRNNWVRPGQNLPQVRCISNQGRCQLQPEHCCLLNQQNNWTRPEHNLPEQQYISIQGTWSSHLAENANMPAEISLPEYAKTRRESEHVEPNWLRILMTADHVCPRTPSVRQELYDEALVLTPEDIPLSEVRIDRNVGNRHSGWPARTCVWTNNDTNTQNVPEFDWFEDFRKEQTLPRALEKIDMDSPGGGEALWDPDEAQRVPHPPECTTGSSDAGDFMWGVRDVPHSSELELSVDSLCGNVSQRTAALSELLWDAHGHRKAHQDPINRKNPTHYYGGSGYEEYPTRDVGLDPPIFLNDSFLAGSYNNHVGFEVGGPEQHGLGGFGLENRELGGIECAGRGRGRLRPKQVPVMGSGRGRLCK